MQKLSVKKQEKEVQIGYLFHQQYNKKLTCQNLRFSTLGLGHIGLLAMIYSSYVIFYIYIYICVYIDSFCFMLLHFKSPGLLTRNLHFMYFLLCGPTFTFRNVKEEILLTGNRAFFFVAEILLKDLKHRVSLPTPCVSKDMKKNIFSHSLIPF